MPDEVDLDALHEVTGGDAEFERELIRVFVASGDRCLADIVASLPAADRDTIGRRAHSLKGASASIYAHRLSAAAADLETAARADDGCDLGALVGELALRLGAVNARLARVG